MMEPSVIPAALALAAVLVSTYTDLRNQVIPNWLTISLTAVGITFYGLLGALQGNLATVASGALGAALAFAIGYALWRVGVWAGGDVKLFTALGALLFSYKMPTGNPIYPVPLSILFNGAIVAAPFLFAYAVILRAQGQSVFFAQVRVAELKEGMIPAETIFEKEGIVYSCSGFQIRKNWDKIYADPKRAAGLTNYQIRTLKRLAREKKIGSTIKIKRGIPFAPVLAAGTLITVLYGDLYWLLLKSVLA